jgi:hypothetical protein
MSDEYDFEEIRPPRVDPAVEAAKSVLLDRFFPLNGTDVFYGRQLEIFLEDKFFHWITKKALNELARAGLVGSTRERVGEYEVHFYYPARHRYPRRQIREIVNLMEEFSDPVFTHAMGAHCENLVGFAVAQIGFRIEAINVTGVGGIDWIETGHDLDLLIEGNGVRYGVEIKNQLGYIEEDEFRVKLAMCELFQVRPLFVARMMPKTYIYRTIQAGGFAMIFKDQQYPLLGQNLAHRVRERLNLPVAAIRRFPDTVLKRFEKWHLKKLEGTGTV